MIGTVGAIEVLDLQVAAERGSGGREGRREGEGRMEGGGGRKERGREREKEEGGDIYIYMLEI